MDKRTFENILNGVCVPIVVLDEDLRVVAANESARKIFVDLKDGIGVDPAISNKPGLQILLRKSLEKSIVTSAKVTRKQGFDLEFLVTIKPIDPDTEGGSEAGGPRLMLTFEDRSPLKDAKIMRSEFVANVSHEIRSPLTAISGFVETLRDAARDDPDAQAHFLALMAKEVERMSNLVSNLLSLSQVEVKQRRAPKKFVDPNLIIAQAATAVSPLAAKRGKRLDVQVAQVLPELLGKHDDLVRVLINLLENALNYSAEASVVKLTTALIQGQNPRNPLDQPALCIAVQDQGAGISSGDIPRLTERFYRVDKSRSRNIGGTGLGLAIVKHILVRHRGKLVIESVQGQGSTFSVYLPQAKPDEP